MKKNGTCRNESLLERPELWAPSPEPLWNDDHISSGMLAAHLDAETDAASRKPEFIDNSASWIARKVHPATGKDLLDLGCGPGLYTQRFHTLGFNVSGIDLSPRSIAYAKTHTAREISYLCADYLETCFPENVDLCTMIYCDFGVLPPPSRKSLLQKVFNALASGGSFFVDVFSLKQYAGFRDSETVTEYPSGGFWAPLRHTVIESRRAYQEDRTFLHQVGVISTKKFKIYHIWEHVFTRCELESELLAAGFSKVEFYSDICGTPFSSQTKTICAVARK